MFESVDARTDARTPARVPSYKLTLWAFGSGELKKQQQLFQTFNMGKFFIQHVSITISFDKCYSN